MPLTLLGLAQALRLTVAAAPVEPVAGILQRMLDAATVAVEGYAAAAPEAVKEQASIQLCGWLYDASPVARRTQNPMHISGAMALLSRWHEVTA